MNSMKVCVDFNDHGAWDVEMPYPSEPVTCRTLDEATRVAYRCAADRRPCELIVRDAYHRVLRHEIVNGEQAASPRA
jgi:hypothetical protein